MADQPPTLDAAPPSGRSARAVSLFLILFALLLAADLMLKWWAFNRWATPPVDFVTLRQRMEALPPPQPGLEADRRRQVAMLIGDAVPHDSAVIIPNVLALKLTLNTGAVFGMWSGYRIVFILATAVAIGVVGFFFLASRANQWVLHTALAMVLAGALGNLYDRINYHAVRDMLWLLPEVKLPFGWTWPGGNDDAYPWIFNLADVYLLAGIGIILLRSLIVPDPRKTPAQDQPQPDQR